MQIQKVEIANKEAGIVRNCTWELNKGGIGNVNWGRRIKGGL